MKLNLQQGKMSNGQNVVVLWHDGNFGRAVSSNLGDIKVIIVNDKDQFDEIVKICERHVPMTTKDITPKIPEGHPLNPLK